MAKRKLIKTKKRNTTFYEDYEDMRGKGTKREKRKAKRHVDKRLLRDLKNPDNIDYDELEDYMDDLTS